MASRSEVFTDDQIAKLREAWKSLRPIAAGMDDATLKKEAVALARLNPFGELDGVLDRYVTAKLEPTAEIVRCNNELNRRGHLEVVTDMFETGATLPEVPVPEVADHPVDRFAETHRDALGTGDLLSVARAAHGLQEQMRDTDPAVLRAVAAGRGDVAPGRDPFGAACALAVDQELYDRAHPEVAQARVAAGTQLGRIAELEAASMGVGAGM